MGQLGAAESAHDLLAGRVPVIHHDVIIRALLDVVLRKYYVHHSVSAHLVGLQLKLCE